MTKIYTYDIIILHRIAMNQTAKVGKAPDALERVPEMMDTPPILLSDEYKGVAIGYTFLFFVSSLRLASFSLKTIYL